MVSGFGMGGGKEVGTGARSAARDFRLARELTDRQLARGGGSLTRNHANDTVNPTAAAGGARVFPDGSFRQRAREAAGENGVLESRERAAGLGRLLADIRNTRTIRDARRRQAEAAGIRNLAEARGLEAENLRGLGVTGVADDAAAPILADDVLGRDWVRTVEEYARKGVALRAMLGSIERQGRSGGRERIRAWISGDGKTILVQADHPDLDWKQLLAHEELHRLIKEDGAYRKAVEERLLGDEKLRPYLFTITDRYMQRYLETEPGMTEEDVIEELLADYRAGFDMLDPLGLSEPAAAKLAKRAARDIRAVERKGVAPTESSGELQQKEQYSAEIEVDSVTPNRAEIMREFQHNFTGRVFTEHGVRLSTQERERLQSELMTGNGKLGADGLLGEIAIAGKNYRFWVDANGDVTVYKKESADVKDRHRAIKEDVYGGSGQYDQEIDGATQGSRGGRRYGTDDFMLTGRGERNAANDPMAEFSQESEDRRYSGADEDDFDYVEQINKVSRTTYKRRYPKGIIKTADGMTLNNDLGASDAEIEAEANEGKASREVDPDVGNAEKGRTSKGKASTEIDADYLSDVNSVDMETAQLRIPAEQTPWQEYLEWYTRQIGELTWLRLSPPEERETIWQRYLHQQEKEREIEKALKTVEILGTVPEEYAALLEEAPGTDALVALRHWEDRRRKDN